MKTGLYASLSFVSSGALAHLPATTPACPDEIGTRCWWFEHFEKLKKTIADNGDKIKIAFLGDSITHFWDSKGAEAWRQNFACEKYQAVNLGMCGDRTEHILWRIGHGLFDNFSPKAIVLEIGVNNTWHRDFDHEVPGDTIYGIRMVVRTLLARCPGSKIILHPIFPCGANADDKRRQRNDIVNMELPRICDGRRVLWCDFNSRLLEPDGVTYSESMAADGVHPEAKAYGIWADALKPHLDFVLGYSDKKPEGCKWVPNDPCDPSKPYMSAWIDYRTGLKREEIAANPDKRYDLVLVGDSITHNWEERGPVAMREILGDYKVLNLGFSGDRVENMLWGTLYGGFFDNYSARVITLLVGVNNTWSKKSTPEEIAKGIALCAREIKKKQPEAKLLLMPLLPWGAKPDSSERKTGDAINAELRKTGVADGHGIIWFDFSDKLLEPDGTLPVETFPDGLHPADDVYNLWARELLPYLEG